MLFSGARCDKCGTETSWETAMNKKWLTIYLRKAGWSVGQRTLCPKCRNCRVLKGK